MMPKMPMNVEIVARIQMQRRGVLFLPWSKPKCVATSSSQIGSRRTAKVKDDAEDADERGNRSQNPDAAVRRIVLTVEQAEVCCHFFVTDRKPPDRKGKR